MEIVIFAEDGTTITLKVGIYNKYSVYLILSSTQNVQGQKYHLPTSSTAIRVYVLDANGLENSFATSAGEEVG